MEKTNWKAWVSVVLSAFLGGIAAHVSVPHEGLGAKQVVLGALLAGAAAVAHLFQQPKISAEPKVEEPKVEA